MDDTTHSHEQPQASTSVLDPAASNPPSPPSALGQPGIAALAGVLGLVLLDLAIETFLAGSPVRWIAAGVVATCAALGVLLRRRLSAPAVAWSALFVLLGLVAVAAWMPNGTTAGVVVLRQPTSRVLAAVAVIGVVLASLTIARLKFLPLPGKAIVGLVALYGLWALTWGIILQTPYPALLHGQSSWQLLPFWLQGAFVGAVILVPAGLLAHLLAGRERVQQGQLGGWARQAVALALIVAVSSAGIPGSSTTVVSPATGAASAPADPGLRAYPAREATIGMPGGRPESYEQSVERVDRLTRLVQGLAGLVDPAAVDVAARAARNGTDVSANFAFVRDSIRFEPYAGVMRGAQGALIAASANALDRTLLLARLLESHGYKTRIAQGTLGGREVQSLVTAFVDGRSTSGKLPAAKVAEVVQQAGEAQMLQAADAVRSRGERVRDWVRARATADTATLRGAMGDATRWFRDGGFRKVQEQLASHYWLQVERDAAWVDLDSSFPGAQPGQRFAEASAFFEPSNLPDDLQHTVRVTMTAEYAEDGERSETTVLDATIPAPDLVTEHMRLTNEPVDLRKGGSLSAARRFRASLRVGQKSYEGSEYSLGGPAAPGAMPDLGGALFGGEAPAAKNLSALWLEVTPAGPGRTARAARRYLIDRVGTAARAKGGSGAALRDVPLERLPYLALGVYEILVMPAPYPEFMAHYLTCRSAIENEALLRRSLEVRFGRGSRSSLMAAAAKSRASVFSPALASLASSVSEYLDVQQGAGRLALQSPFVAMFTQAFVTESVLRDPVGKARARQGFDIMAPAAVPIGGNPEQRAERGLAYGAFLTDLELAMAMEIGPPGSAGVDNTSLAVEAGKRAGRSLAVLRNAGDETGIAGTPDALAAMRSDLQAGQVLVTLAQTKQEGTARDATWWRVDPDTGVGIGVNEHAEGQAMTEEQMFNFAATMAAAAWCEVKTAGKDLNEFGQLVGYTVCMVGWATGMIGVFATIPAAVVVGLAVGMLGDICDTN
jgi:hypothetical protein